MNPENIIELQEASVGIEHNIILHDIYLEVKKGEFIYLIGKTGSGKSSLLKTLYCDIPVAGGHMHVVGYDLTKIRRREIPYLRRKMGIVFQDFQLLTDRSVKDNLLFVMKATGWKDKLRMQERVQTALQRVGLATKDFKFIHELSGGEQQRVGIARALINDPDIILADEPTGNLDPETSEGILALLFEIRNSGRAVLMATHNHALMEKFPSRTLKCCGGHIIDGGTED